MAYAGFLRTLPAPASTLSGFVCLLDTTWFTQADANALDGTTFINGGGSLRLYTDATKTTQLPVDVVSFVTGGTPEVKVFTRLPSYASGSTIWVESDASATTQPVPTSTYGSEAVWQDYYAVLPLSSGSYDDVTGNNRGGVAVGTLTQTSVDSPYGVDWTDFNTSRTSRLVLSNTSGLLDNQWWTISAWVKARNTNETGGIVSNRVSGASSNWFQFNSRGGSSSEDWQVALHDGSGESSATFYNDPEIGNTEFVSIIADPTGLKLNVNGVNRLTNAYAGDGQFINSQSITVGNYFNNSLGFTGFIGDIRIRAGAASDDLQLSEYTNQSSPSTFGSSSGWTTGGGGPTYSLTLDAGAYTYTGSSVNLAANRALTIDSGSYSYSGSEVSLSVGRAITLNAGTYAYTGNAAALRASRKISIDSGSYAYTGNAVTLTYTPSGGPTYQLTLDPGVYNYNGSDTQLAANRKLAIDSASYNYTGNDVSLSAGRAITLTPGSYSISGQDVSLRVSRAITIDAASYDYSGYPVALSYSGQIISLISGYSVEYKQDDITGGYKLDDVSADYEQDYINVRFL